MITKTVRERLLASTMICGAAFIALSAAPSFAQQSEAETAETEEVIVTGSRIRVRDATSTSPVVTVEGDTLQEIGTATVETYLNSLPQLSPSVTKTNNNPAGGGSAFLDLRQLGTARGLVLVDGRRLVPGASSGAVDVSILPGGILDRVEIVTGGASAVYGADAISGVVNFLLRHDFEGLEVSSQYGISDRGDAAEYSMNLVTGGKFADDRGSVVFAASFTHRDSLGQAEREFSQQAQYCDIDGCIPSGSGNTGEGTINLTQANVNGILGQATGAAAGDACTPGALGVRLGSLVGVNFTAGSTLTGAQCDTLRNQVYSGQRLGFNPDQSIFIAGTDAFGGRGVFGYTGPNNTGYDPARAYGYNFNPVNLLVSPFDRYNLYTDITYDISDNVEFYGNALFSTYSSQAQLAESPAAFPVTVATATTISPALRAQLEGAGITGFTINRRTREFGPRIYNYDTTAWQISGGLRGEVPGLFENRWDYDVFSSFGRYEGRQEFGGFPSRVRINAALGGCLAGSPPGPVGSAGTVTSCVPFNPFGANNINQAQVEYIEAKGQFQITEIEQTNLIASLAGDLFALPAGNVGFALGAEYRDIQYDDTPPEAVQTGDLLGGNSAGPVSGGYDVYELFAETRVPILADLPFVHYLGAEAGYRYSDYSTGSSTSTYKYGGEYAPTNWLRFRGLAQRAVRAPSVGELFATVAEGFPPANPNTDPCDKDNAARTGANGAQVLALCQAQAPVITAAFDQIGAQYRVFSGGNPNLEPEVADSTTIGAVFSGRNFGVGFLQPLTVTVDYWDIEINNVVSAVGAATSRARCYSAVYNPTFTTANIYCQNVVRDPTTGQLTSTGLSGFTSQRNANLATFLASGVDFAFAYNFDASDIGLSDRWGRFQVSSTATYYENQQFQSLPGDQISDNLVGGIGDGTPGDTTLPEWKVSSRIAWQVADFGLSLRWAFIDEVVDRNATEANGFIPSVEAYNYFYLNGNWKVNDTFELFGGIDNLTDEQPPIYTSGFQYSTDPSTYDTIGRYYYVGVRARF